jgi:hypothetical protein
MAREGAHPIDGADPGQGELAALRAQLWYPDVDGVLFEEAVRCFEQGGYRAALVMTWLAIAEGLRYRPTDTKADTPPSSEPIALPSPTEEPPRRPGRTIRIEASVRDRRGHGGRPSTT